MHAVRVMRRPTTHEPTSGPPGDKTNLNRRSFVPRLPPPPPRTYCSRLLLLAPASIIRLLNTLSDQRGPIVLNLELCNMENKCMPAELKVSASQIKWIGGNDTDARSEIKSCEIVNTLFVKWVGKCWLLFQIMKDLGRLDFYLIGLQ